jgi:hypothetical protein
VIAVAWDDTLPTMRGVATMSAPFLSWDRLPGYLRTESMNWGLPSGGLISHAKGSRAWSSWVRQAGLSLPGERACLLR